MGEAERKHHRTFCREWAIASTIYVLLGLGMIFLSDNSEKTNQLWSLAMLTAFIGMIVVQVRSFLRADERQKALLLRAAAVAFLAMIILSALFGFQAITFDQAKMSGFVSLFSGMLVFLGASQWLAREVR
ncbi:MAG: hypothetical protein AAGJ31_15800, partial [Verrucomicrobiota bacterium]